MSVRVFALAGVLAVRCVSASPGPDTPSLSQLLSRHIDALGGSAAVESTRSRSMLGCYLPTSETPCVPFEVHASGSAKWKTVMTAPGILRMERMDDGTRAWDYAGDQRRGLEPAVRWANAAAFHFDFLHHPEKHLSALTVTGWSADRKAVEAEGTLPDGARIGVRFDAKSGLISQIGDYAFEDYRPVAGMLAPVTIRLVKNGTVYRFPTIIANPVLGDELFTPDGSAASFASAKQKMRIAALDEAVRGLDVSAEERAVLESLDFFSPHEGRMLFDLIRQRGYKRGLEIGTAWGNSAIWMAMAFKRNGGKLVTIELRPEFAARAKENFAKAGLAGTVESRVNDAFKEIPAIEGGFDLVFMDTGTNLHRKFLDLTAARVSPGGAIISHNADTFGRDQPDFRRAVMEDPELETSLLLTPGGGMSVSIRRPRG